MVLPMPIACGLGCFSVVAVVRDEGAGIGLGYLARTARYCSQHVPWSLAPKVIYSDSICSVTLVVLIGLAIVSVPTWIFVNNFGAHPNSCLLPTKQD